MKLFFISSLFALTACLDAPTEPLDRTTSDLDADTAATDATWYCVQAWETDNVCIEINAGFFQAALQCRDACARAGYANPACTRVASYLDACPP